MKKNAYNSSTSFFPKENPENCSKFKCSKFNVLRIYIYNIFFIFIPFTSIIIFFTNNNSFSIITFLIRINSTLKNKYIKKSENLIL